MWISNSKTKYSSLIMLVDATIVNLCIVAAYLIRFNLELPEFNFRPYVEMFIWISIGAIFFLNTYHMYSFSARTRWDDQFYSIVLAVTLTLMFSITLTYVSANYSFPRTVFVLSGLLQVIFLTIWRYFLWKTTKKILGSQKAILMGNGEVLNDLVERIKKFSENHIQLVGLITEKPFKKDCGKPIYKILGSFSDYKQILLREDYDVIILAPSLDIRLKEEVVSYCYSSGKEVMLIPDLYEVLLIKSDLSLLDDVPVLTVNGRNGDTDPVKRMLDVIVGSAAIIFTIPLMLIIGLIIKLESPGTIIFKQERVTKGGRAFILYKFRTMVQDAERGIGPVFAVEDDQRATRVGNFLRKSRLDELPQFFNVVKGDMSLVGPRPERPFFVEQYSKLINGYDNRHRMKPGITGIAQIAGKYNTGPREKLVFDLLYSKKNNILVDLKILLHTVKVLFMRDKAS